MTPLKSLFGSTVAKRRVKNAIEFLTSYRPTSSVSEDLAALYSERERMEAQYPALVSLTYSQSATVFTENPRTAKLVSSYGAILEGIRVLEAQRESEKREAFKRRASAISTIAEAQDVAGLEVRDCSTVLGVLIHVLEESGSEIYPAVVQILTRALHHTDSMLRKEAVAVTAQIAAPPDKVRLLVESVADQDPQVRATAIEALGNMEDAIALSPLKKALYDEEPDVRSEAITALAAIGDEGVIPDLIEMLLDRETSVRLRAIEALAWITKVDFGEDTERWQEWWQSKRQ